MSAALLFFALVTASQQAEPLRVLVLTPTSEAVEKDVLESTASLVSVELDRIAGLEVITTADVKKLAALEAEKQAVGCDDSSCLAELAGAMGARFVVFGDAAKLGTLTVVNLNLFDSAEAKSVGRVSIQLKAIEELPEQLPPKVKELVGPAFGAQGVAVSSEPAAAPSSSTTVSAAPAEGGTFMAPVWTFGLLGAGVVVALAGVGFDLVSPTSGNAAIDAGDFVGPALVGVGLGVGVLGLAFNPFAGGDDA